MPLASVKLRPGLLPDFTPTLNEAGYQDSNLIRFRDGLAEKLGGWSRYYPTAISSPVRDLHAWQDLNAALHLGVGAEQTLSVITSGANTNITPRTLTSNPTVDVSTTIGTPNVIITDPGIQPSTYDTVFITTPISVGGLILLGAYPIDAVTGAHSYRIIASSNATATVNNGGAVPVFDTTNGLSAVTVTLANHGEAVGNSVYYLVSTTVGGIVVTGLYPVNSVGSVNAYTINGANAATATQTAAMNGGNARFTYFIALGPPMVGSGYGVGPYGMGGYGLGVPVSPGTGNPITATDWTLDNWGQDFIACPAGGAIYTWTPGTGFTTASLLRNAPTVNDGIFVAMPEQILVAWGSSFDGVPDPLLVRWTAVSDNTDWIASSIDQAGKFRIPTGSRLVGGIQAPQQGLLWTDLDLWSMQYQGPPFVFGFNKLATGCGLIGRHAMGILAGTIYWMGSNQFYVLGGQGAQGIPCPVWDVVFQDIDNANVGKIRCATNSGFDEVAWFYPSLSGGTGEIDRYVKFNAALNAWDYGRLARTAWIDQSVLGQPIGADPNGLIFQHEISKNADGAAMNPYFVTGYAMISNGTEQTFVDWMIPDFKFGFFNAAQSASIKVTFYSVEYPSDTPKVYGPYTVTQATQFVTTRLRGRAVSMRVESDDLNSFWRIGNIRYRGAPDGRR